MERSSCAVTERVEEPPLLSSAEFSLDPEPEMIFRFRAPRRPKMENSHYTPSPITTPFSTAGRVPVRAPSGRMNRIIGFKIGFFLVFPATPYTYANNNTLG